MPTEITTNWEIIAFCFHIPLTILAIVSLFVYDLHRFFTNYAYWAIGLTALVSIIMLAGSIYQCYSGNCLSHTLWSVFGFILWNLLLILGFVRLLIIEGDVTKYPD